MMLSSDTYRAIAFAAAMALYLLVAYFAIRASRREGVVSTALIFVVSASIYYVAIPVELYLTEVSEYASAGMYIAVSDSSKLLLIVNGALSVLAFVIGYRCSGFSLAPEASLTPVACARHRRQLSFETAIYAMMAVSALLILTCFRGQLSMSMSGYESNYENIYNNPAYSYLIYVFTVSLSAAAFVNLCIKRNVAVAALLIAVGVALGVLTSDKNPILIALLPLVARLGSYLGTNRYGRLVSVTVILMGMICTLVLIPAFSLYRAGFDVFTLDILDSYYFSFTRIDPSGPFVSLSQAIDRQPPVAAGLQYLKNLSILVPKGLWPDRPIDLGEQFARDFMPQWAPGRGFGYSLMAEGVVNFGAYFCSVHYLIVGFFWGGAWRLIARFVQQPLYVQGLYRTLGFYLLILMHRGSSMSVIKTMMHFFVPLVVIVTLARVAIPMLRILSSPARAHDLPVRQ